MPPAKDYVRRRRPSPRITSETAKVIKLVGTSTDSWEDAAQSALDDADETLEGITGIEIES
ncbi:hypothetical protein C486_08535 [Natrinema gari JCM 14663]|uniref:Dodecin domain-containing protein n=2 Tax=Natrinema TaxID=88723 RepID=L9Z3H0_9EURY|nr:dodecin family protein [Natrinema gari]ELY80436.1 hypothetical protein C486_08535 [Natrinema gari JCM 14663]